MTPTIVSGAVSNLTDLGRDEAWLQGWLKEQPSRLGLGELTVEATPAEDPAADPGAFMASLDGRCFSVDVHLGELDASHGFGVLDAWARNKARQPEKDHVAVLVTETCGDRYRTTLETLTRHLPLVVVELAVWRGENEAILIPHVALSSEGVDLGSAPASAAASALSRVKAAVETDRGSATRPTTEAGKPAPKTAKDEVKVGSETTNDADGAEPAVTKDDTGVADPWGLPRKEPEAVATSNGSRLLKNFDT